MANVTLKDLRRLVREAINMQTNEFQVESVQWREAIEERDELDDETADIFYENTARTIVYNWNNGTEDVSWRKVAENYAKGQRSMGGPHLDVNKLYEALVEFLDKHQDVRDPNLSKVKKVALGSPCTKKEKV